MLKFNKLITIRTKILIFINLLFSGEGFINLNKVIFCMLQCVYNLGEHFLNSTCRIKVFLLIGWNMLTYSFFNFCKGELKALTIGWNSWIVYLWKSGLDRFDSRENRIMYGQMNTETSRKEFYDQSNVERLVVQPFPTNYEKNCSCNICS